MNEALGCNSERDMSSCVAALDGMEDSGRSDDETIFEVALIVTLVGGYKNNHQQKSWETKHVHIQLVSGSWTDRGIGPVGCSLLSLSAVMFVFAVLLDWSNILTEGKRFKKPIGKAYNKKVVI